MRRGFCNSNDNENSGSGCEVSELANFSQELDSSLIRNQKRNFVRLVSNQVDELKKKITSITPKNRRGHLGGTSRTSARSVRFRPTGSRPGFCTEDVKCSSKNSLKSPSIFATHQCPDTSSEPHTDYEADREDCPPRSNPSRRDIFGSNAVTPQSKPSSSKSENPCDEYSPVSGIGPCGKNIPKRRNRSPPRGFLSDCSAEPTCRTSSFPAECRQHRRSWKWLILLILLLILLLLLAASVYYYLKCRDSPYNGCSPEGTVRYVPY